MRGGPSWKRDKNSQVEFVLPEGKCSVLEGGTADRHVQRAFRRIDGNPRAVCRIGDPEANRACAAREKIARGFYAFDKRGLGIHDKKKRFAVFLVAVRGQRLYGTAVTSVFKAGQFTAQIDLPLGTGGQLKRRWFAVGCGFHQGGIIGNRSGRMVRYECGGKRIAAGLDVDNLILDRTRGEKRNGTPQKNA